MLRVLWRTLFLQACWNFQRMQNLGFAFALDPLLRVIYREPAARVNALRRHTDFFVTHPYFASLILGVTARLEADRAEAGEAEQAAVNQIKAGMMGPLAALGDSLFWATLKPLWALLGVVLVWLTPAGETWPAWAGPVVFLVAFTACHLSVRAGGLWAGFARGLGIVQDLRRLRLQAVVNQLMLVLAVVAGGAAAAYVAVHRAELGGGAVAPVAFAAVSGAALWGLRRGLSVSTLLYGFIVLGLAAAVLGWRPGR